MKCRVVVYIGFAHSAFTFAYESLVIKSTAAQTEIPPGALITFLQKGLEYIAIEEHISEDGTIQDFENNFSLLSPLICESVATKEDRRSRTVPSSSSAANLAAVQSSSSLPTANNLTNATSSTHDVVPMEEDDPREQKVIPSTYNLA